LFGAESLFYLAVLDCVKPDIDQVASVVYCMIEFDNSKDDRSSTFKSEHKYHWRSNFIWHGLKHKQQLKNLKSGTQMEQLCYNSIAISGPSYFWITLQPHAAYNGSICLRHTFHHLAATR
jgi:hypothetical protein